MKVTFCAPFAEWEGEVKAAEGCTCDNIRSAWLGWMLPLCGQRSKDITDRCRCGKTLFAVPPAP